MNKVPKKKEEINNAEYGVDSRYKSKKSELEESRRLMESRLERMNSLTEGQLLKARLLQLKLRMEDFIKQPIGSGDNFFTDFLKFYIDTIYKKRRDFAEDIDETPVLLSKVLNKHREPSKEFMLKLMVHTEKTFENICPIKKSMWHKVYYHEQIYETIFNQEIWRPKIEKQVKIRKSINA